MARILLAGATGMVGGLLLAELERTADNITLVTRRPVPGAGASVAQKVGEACEWPSLISGGTYDIAISTLGTTIRAAGSRDAFSAIDLDAVVAFAAAARAAGATHFMMVSSVGADATARNFYLSVKGKAEDAVGALGFDRIDIFRPGLLRGSRGGAHRPGESIAMAVSPLTDLLTPQFVDKYRSIDARDVAKALAAKVHETDQGVHIHHNREMWQ
jgi:uncharacterized protein YbjT (DUF2867 family)